MLYICFEFYPAVVSTQGMDYTAGVCPGIRLIECMRQLQLYIYLKKIHKESMLQSEIMTQTYTTIISRVKYYKTPIFLLWITCANELLVQKYDNECFSYSYHNVK